VEMSFLGEYIGIIPFP